MGRWNESMKFNQLTLELNPADDAAWWNLGIAATALRDWSEARRAWRAYGIEVEGQSGEVLTPGTCVRLNPTGSGEVVWGQRLDPARIVILSVPLPESAHRFYDIILNDGASNGTRIDDDGVKVPVFEELSIWQVSEYSTFSVKLQIRDEDSERQLVAYCHTGKLGIEDWSTVRFLCAACSRGNPGKHDCKAKPLEDGSRRFGFAAKEKEDLVKVLAEWATSSGPADFAEPELVLAAKRM